MNGRIRKTRRVRRARRTTWLACATLLLALGARAPAQTAKIQLNAEDWGMGGVVKGGLWSYLYVELKSAGEDFSGTLEVEADAGQAVKPVFIRPIQLVADTPAHYWVYFRAPASTWRSAPCRCSWKLRDLRGRTVLTNEWRNPVLLPIADSVVGVFSASDRQNAGLDGLLDVNSEVRVNPRTVSAPWAPDRALGYESADALVWLNPNPAHLTDPAQADAIVSYVRQGGHLVLAAGAGWQALSGSFLSKLLPAQPTGSFLAANGLSGLAKYEPPLTSDPFPVMRLMNVRGEVLAEQDGYPLIVRGSFGMGRVTLIAFDPTKDPFPSLGQRGRFWADILQMDVTPHDARAVGSLRPASATMIQALNDFPGIKPVNFWFVGLFLVGYVVLIGPVDYFVLKRLKKLHWTWITFPCVAVLFSGIAFLVMSSGRVLALASNSVSIVDAAQGDAEASGATFMTFLSPSQTRYNLAVASPAVGSVTPLEFDVAGQLRGGGSSLTATSCDVIARGEHGESVAGLLVRVWDAQSVVSSWRAPAGKLPEVTAALSPDGRCRVTVANDTTEALEDAMLILPNGFIRLGTLPSKHSSDRPGAAPAPMNDLAASLLPELSRSEMHGRGFRGQETATSRNQAGAQARMVSLFNSASSDGAPGAFRRWAHGQNDYLSVAFDLAARVQLSPPGKNQAILVYTIHRPFASIEIEGRQPNRWDVTVVRLRVPLAAAPKPQGE